MRPLRPMAPPGGRPPEGRPPGEPALPGTAPATPSAAAPAAARTGDRLARNRAGRRRRSATVRALRVLAPLLMVVIAAVLVGWIWGRAKSRRAAPESAGSVSIHMTNPRFIGRDSHDRPFVLTGSDAVRDTRDPHLVALTAPHLVLQPAPERVARADPRQPPLQPFVVTALNGLYHDDTHHLTMMGNVVVNDGRGNTFYSDKGEVDTDSGDVTGHDRARGEGPDGAISGDAYALSDKGDHATFTGHVKSHLNNSKGAPAAAVRKAP